MDEQTMPRLMKELYRIVFSYLDLKDYVVLENMHGDIFVEYKFLSVPYMWKNIPYKNI